jgi:hypothetical protein
MKRSVSLAAFAAAAGTTLSLLAAGPIAGPVTPLDELPPDLKAPSPRANELVPMALPLRTMIDPAAFARLTPIHQSMLNRVAHTGLSGPVVACFEPSTSPEVMDAFNRAIFGFADRYTEGPRWEVTATNGPTGVLGDPITLTYSFIPDGTIIPNGVGEGEGPSNLFERMNGIYGNQATWQAHYHAIFARWGELTGVTYVFEPNDDGSPLVSNSGQLGVRGDLRLGGKFIDGNSGILAYNYYPDSGDMVIDTGDNFFENLNNNSLRLRNVLAHEHGHGMGQPHVCPIIQTKLMEPFVSTAYDGPRHDDVRSAHRMYGDAFEPNDTNATATPLGLIPNTSDRNIGTVPGAPIANGSIASIHRADDADFYSFSTSNPVIVRIAVTPVGLVYEDAPQNCDGFNGRCCFGTFTDSLAMADLAFEIINSSGSVIASSNFFGPGETESTVAALPAAGLYRLRVISAVPPEQPQLYTASITTSSAGAGLELASVTTPPEEILPATPISFFAQAVVLGASQSNVRMNLSWRASPTASFQTVPMSIVLGNLYQAQVPAAPCGSQLQYFITGSVLGTSTTRRLPQDANSYFTATVGTPVTIFSDSMEFDAGWTVSGDAQTGQWVLGEPLGTGAQPEFDVSPDPAQNCFFTGQGTNPASLGEADVDNGTTILTSPVFSAVGIARPTLNYWRWYDNARGASPNNDIFTVELSSDNGATWVLAETAGPATDNVGGWKFRRIPLSSVSGLLITSTMRVRFSASDLGAGSIVEAAVDEVSLTGLVCDRACPADWNNDGGVDGDDVIAFFAAWDAGNADFNNDGGTDGDDVIAFFGRWDAGC